MSSRLEREREFHDHVFTEQDVRAPTLRFKTVTGALSRWNLQTLSAHAAGARALEYGCGQGSRAFHLARGGAHVVGIDISPVAIEQAIEHARAEGLEDRLTFRVMDAEQLEFADDSFNLVCGSGVLHHLDLNRAYAEVARVLEPTGIGVFEEPLGHNPAINAYRRRTPEMRTVDEHPLLMGDLALAERYFGEVNTRFFTLSSLAAVPLRNLPGFELVVRALDSVDRSLFRVAPAVRRYAWHVGITLRHPRPSGADAGR
jgi:ubiquinone/menaquinone biosynthesis C-methylase UbiE